MLGVALIIACTTVIAFMFFGKLLQVCGGGEFFTDISSAAFGRYRGGSGKVEVVASRSSAPSPAARSRTSCRPASSRSRT